MIGNDKNKIFFSGYLLRKEILDLKKKKSEITEKELSILIMGGSQSAKVFGEQLPEVIKKCTDNGIKFNIYQPFNTLSFFKLKNNMKVIELQPSGGNSPGGWYTEILAPYLKNNGLLIAAHFNPKESEWRAKMRKGYEKRTS